MDNTLQITVDDARLNGQYITFYYQNKVLLSLDFGTIERAREQFTELKTKIKIRDLADPEKLVKNLNEHRKKQYELKIDCDECIHSYYKEDILCCNCKVYDPEIKDKQNICKLYEKECENE